MNELQMEVPGSDKKITIPSSTAIRNNAPLPSFTHEGEAIFWLLADWRGGGVLAEMRATAMGRAIQAKDSGESEWNKYAQLAAPTKDYCKAKWDAADKVIRHCVIQARLPESETENDKKDDGKFYDTAYLLAHAKNALKGVCIRPFSTCPCTSYHNGFHLCFDSTIHLSIFTQWEGSNDGIENISKSLSKKRKVTNGGTPLFYTVIDVDGGDPDLETEDMLRYLYGQLAGDAASHEAIATKYIGGSNTKDTNVCMTGVSGIVGMEGALFVRNLSNYPQEEDILNVASPVQPLFLCDDGTRDELWGGAVFQLFLISVFQRKRLELAAEHAVGNWKESSRINQTTIRNNLKQMMQLDNTWMYQEMASRTDIDRIYRIYRDALDIPEMWQDIRDQMSRASGFLESESAKLIEKVVTALTVIGLPLAFFTALMTVSDINEQSVPHQFLGAIGVLLLFILVVYSLWPFTKWKGFSKEQVNLSRLVKLFLGVLTFFFIIYTCGILLLESWTFSTGFLH